MDSVTLELANLKQIYLWTNNRSLGTIFLKWLSHLPDSQAINGLFTSCYFYGPESRYCQEAKYIECSRAADGALSDFQMIYDASSVSYGMAKKTLETDYPGKKILVFKDLPYCLLGNHELIPKGFRHTFLIRHPYRMYTSWKRSFGGLTPGCSLQDTIEKDYNNYYNYKEQLEVVQHLIKTPALGDTSPVIFDADDLQNHPESVLRQYCQAIGVPFTNDMLQWSPGVEVVKTWKISKQLLGGGLHDSDHGFYRTAMKSSEFFPAKRLPDRSELDEDVRACADMGMPYYEALYAVRTIKP